MATRTKRCGLAHYAQLCPWPGVVQRDQMIRSATCFHRCRIQAIWSHVFDFLRSEVEKFPSSPSLVASSQSLGPELQSQLRLRFTPNKAWSAVVGSWFALRTSKLGMSSSPWLTIQHLPGRSTGQSHGFEPQPRPKT